MKSLAGKEDLALLPRIFPFTAPADIPISFLYGERTVHGIPDDFSPRVTTERIDASILRRTVTGVDARGLEIRVEYVQYLDCAATEWLAFLTNRGASDTPVISALRIVDGVIPMVGAELYHGNGDVRENGYDWSVSDLSEPVVKETHDGTSCRGAFPYMRLRCPSWGVNVAVGWPAMWRAGFEKTDGGVRLTVGQKRCRTVLHPGETLRTPRVNFVAYAGDNGRGINTWRRWYLTHVLPRTDGQPLTGKYCLHNFMAGGHPEFTGADEENQRTALAEYIRRGLKPDLWWIDAGWYRCHYDWGVTGDWIPDAERFPHGLAPIGEDCRRAGVDFLLWFEPERVRTSTAFCREHPDWLLPRKKSPDDLLVNLGCRACCDTIIDTIDALIKESGIRVYRQDFNFSPASVWAEAEAEDRVGAVENAHVQGLLRLWDTLLDRNPGLWIDMCASGGRRNDLETMRRAVPLHYTDIGYGDHPVKQKQHRQMFEWIPYFRAHNMSWDDPLTGEYTGKDHPADAYAYYVAMAPCMTDMTPYDADEERFALARKMQAIWRRASALMLTGDFYPLTECRESARDFFAVQFHDPETGRGMVEIVSNNANPDERFTVRFAGLEPGARYLLTNAETGARRELTAEEMASGVEYALPRRSGLIDFYEKKV